MTFTAVSTPDVGKIVYSIYRSGQKTPIGTMTAQSWPWALPVLNYHATSLKPKSKLAFTVVANDGTKNSARSAASAPVIISAWKVRHSYAFTVLQSTPAFYWQLNERSGTVAADSTPHNFDGSYQPGTTLGVARPVHRQQSCRLRRPYWPGHGRHQCDESGNLLDRGLVQVPAPTPVER